MFVPGFTSGVYQHDDMEGRHDAVVSVVAVNTCRRCRNKASRTRLVSHPCNDTASHESQVGVTVVLPLSNLASMCLLFYQSVCLSVIVLLLCYSVHHIYFLTWSLIHSPTHTLIHSLTRSLTHSLTRSHTHPLPYSLGKARI